MNKNDEQKFGLYVFIGIAIGGIIGCALGAANGNIFYGFWAGALIGGFLGWFTAAAVLKKASEKKKTNKLL